MTKVTESGKEIRGGRNKYLALKLSRNLEKALFIYNNNNNMYCRSMRK